MLKGFNWLSLISVLYFSVYLYLFSLLVLTKGNIYSPPPISTPSESQGIFHSLEIQ